ncbi:hypothetical protein [Bradyrhizobium sp. CB2312]|uniref:hypothetical protein n=1 Tax=Bradyrhizobium sp. CB2312 TaxID=3039155 RepID=UPI0024B1E221|nr:hypothetical protein [Bradyrhizobium sp. CB2312]WFU73367.1 hypothetical protein QA642_04655 [Bradyrhizobium sp. CB2312]
MALAVTSALLDHQALHGAAASLREVRRSDHTTGVIARLDRAIQYSETALIASMGRGVLDAPLSRSMTARMTRGLRGPYRFSITRL